jgi:hypothetical protein
MVWVYSSQALTMLSSGNPGEKIPNIIAKGKTIILISRTAIVVHIGRTES